VGSQAILDFLAATDMGRQILDPARKGAQSEVSEWGLRGREKAEERRRQEEELGAEVEERLQFFPNTPFLVPTEEE